MRRHLAGALADLGLETRTDRLGNLIATLDGEAGRAVGHAVHPYGPARLRGPQDRGRRLHPRRAAGRRAGAGAAVAGRADLRRRGPRPRRRHRQQEPPRDDAGGKIQGRALCRPLHRCRLRQPRRSACRRRRYRHAGRLPAAGDGAVGQPHRRHLGRRPRRLRRHRRGGARPAASGASARPSISCFRCRRSSTCAAR